MIAPKTKDDAMPQPGAQDLLAYLHRDGRWAYLWTKKGNSKQSHWFQVGEPIPTLDSNTHNIYFGVHPTGQIPTTNTKGELARPTHVRSQIEHVTVLNCLFSEFDAKDFGHDKQATMTHIEALPVEPSAIVDSGGGYHAYWLLATSHRLHTDQERARMRRVQAAWVAFTGGDKGAKDLARVLRLPGTYNLKYTPSRYVRFVKADFAQVYPLADLEERLAHILVTPDPRAGPDRDPVVTKPYTYGDDVAAAAKNLERLHPGRCDNYQEWVTVGMALSELGQVGLALWEDWSKQSAKYEPGVCAKKWMSFTPGDGVTLASLRHWADQDDPQPQPPRKPPERRAEPEPGKNGGKSPTDTPENAGLPLDCPDLPEYARLTPEQSDLAATAGRWLDDYVRFASEAAPMTPRPFHVAAGLSMGSLAIARRLCLAVSVSQNHIFPNLYMLYIGPSTIQRKTTAFAVVRGLLKAAELKHFLLADRQTPEALGLDLTTRIPPTYETWEIVTQELWRKERALAAQRGWFLEEASHLMDSFNRDFTSGLLPMVLDLYDAPESALSSNSVSRGRAMVENAYLTIYGVTTYGAMAEHLQKKTLWSNGFFARFALVGSDNVRAWRFWPEPKCYPSDLVQRLRFVATELLPTPKAYITEIEIQDADGARKVKQIELTTPLVASKVVLERGGPAWQAWERYAKATGYDLLIGRQISERFKPSYGRLGTMLAKIAMILAVFDTKTLPVVVEPRHVYKGQQILETWRANLHDIFGKLQVIHEDDTGDKIKAVLAKKGREWTTRRDLLRSLSMKWSDIERMVNDLIAGGEIETEDKKNGNGTTSTIYRLIP